MYHFITIISHFGASCQSNTHALTRIVVSSIARMCNLPCTYTWQVYRYTVNRCINQVFSPSYIYRYIHTYIYSYSNIVFQSKTRSQQCKTWIVLIELKHYTTKYPKSRLLIHYYNGIKYTYKHPKTR